MLLKVLVLAVVIERVWEHLQQVAGDAQLSLRVKLLGSLVLSVTTALSFRVDILYALEVMPEASMPGYVLTGFVLSLGSNVIHDLIDVVNGLSVKHKSSLSQAGR